MNIDITSQTLSSTYQKHVFTTLLYESEVNALDIKQYLNYHHMQNSLILNYCL